MKSRRTMGLWIASALLGIGMCLCAGEFAPPAEGPVAFRRDKIPLDPDTINGLSRQLGNLALGSSFESAENRRGAAQILALAIALDPSNTKARNFLTKLQKGRKLPPADAPKLAKSIARIWQYAAWLNTPEAGSQGQALSACLMDVVARADPQDSRAKAWKTNGEQGSWADWIPPLSAYQKPEIAEANPEPETPPEPVVPEQPKLAAAQIHTPLWQPVKEGKITHWVMSSAPLEMTATRMNKKAKRRPGGPVMVGLPRNGKTFRQLNASLLALLKKNHEPYPSEVRISITSPALQASLQAKRHQSISAATAVLASSALTGVEPQGIIIGQMGSDGAFNLSKDFWCQLRSLEQGEGQRLVLPSAAKDDLPSILALEKPEFFLEYEVLLASDIDGLLEATAKAPQGGLAKAMAKFRTIHERFGNKNVRQYIANRFVRQRLAEIIQDFPGHYSAKMLLIQVAGDRPVVVSRRVLAAELKRAIEPMEWLIPVRAKDYTPDETKKIRTTYEICRSQVNALERYAEKEDVELLEITRKTVMVIRDLERTASSRENYAILLANIGRARANVKLHYKELTKRLDKESGIPQVPTGGF